MHRGEDAERQKQPFVELDGYIQVLTGESQHWKDLPEDVGRGVTIPSTVSIENSPIELRHRSRHKNVDASIQCLNHLVGGPSAADVKVSRGRFNDLRMLRAGRTYLDL